MSDVLEIYSEDAEIQAVMAEIRLGWDAKDFIEKNPIGRQLVTRASRELIEARTALEDTPPDATGTIIKYQTKAAAARLVINWLGELVMQGKQAEGQLENLNPTVE